MTAIQGELFQEITEEDYSDKPEIMCRHCGKVKPREEFRLYRRATGDRESRSTSCKKCQRYNSVVVEDIRKTAPPMSKGCDICGKKTKLVLDHCYENKTFRGWLCHHCNLAIGILGDNIEGLERAIRYVKGERVKRGRPLSHPDETEEERKQRRKAYHREWYLRVRRKGIPFVPLSKEQVKENKKKWARNYRKKNRDMLLAKERKNRAENPDRYREYVRKYYEKNKETINKRVVQRNLEMYHRRKHDPEYRLKRLLRLRLYHVVKKGYKKDSALSLVGCSMDQLKKHLESKFEEGMSWDNWTREGWHIDHIIPLSSFDMSKEEEQKKAMHYTNLQPLWAKDNMRKGSKIDWRKKDEDNT